MKEDNDTIAALATPPGRGAIAVVRVSGPDAVVICSKVTGGLNLASLASGMQKYGRIVVDGEVIDEVMLSVHRSPRSYTGEETVEICCHGGIIVSRRVLHALLAAGGRVAEPGEFTRRAYLNGKLDLAQAEAVIDLINAQTVLAQRTAVAHLEGRLSAELGRIREQLIESLANIEAWIDFPEEGIDPDTGAVLLAGLVAINEGIGRLIDTEGRGRMLREGCRVGIIGPPNAGKSSLLNALLGFERAIVNEQPGTTRDFIEETLDIRGLPVRLVDTAGLREGAGEVEQAGIDRTRRLIGEMDLVLTLFDGSLPPPPAPVIAIPTGTLELVVLNKADLPRHPAWEATMGENSVCISCRTGEGLEFLAERIQEKAFGVVSDGDPMVAVSARHGAALRKAKEAMDQAIETLLESRPPELIAVDLRRALGSVGEVVGTVDIEEILGAIFSRFCIGK